MTGKDKKMNYPETYLIRVSKNLKEKLKKIKTERVRRHLEKLKI